MCQNKTNENCHLCRVVSLIESVNPNDRIEGVRLLGGFPGLEMIEALLLQGMVVGELDPDVQREIVLASIRLVQAVKFADPDVIEVICNVQAVAIGRDPLYEADPPELTDGSFQTFPVTLEPMRDFSA